MQLEKYKNEKTSDEGGEHGKTVEHAHLFYSFNSPMSRLCYVHNHCNS